MTPSADSTHHDLLLHADAWLKRRGCHITLIEYAAATRYGEIPDAIGWRGSGREQVSILIECKVTRGDFLADREKESRLQPEYGMGDWRFFLCPPDMIKSDELPPRWGLLYAHPSGIRHVAGMQWTVSSWNPAPFRACKDAEVMMLVNALRRVQVRGHFSDVYERIESSTTDKGASDESSAPDMPAGEITARSVRATI